MLRFGRTWQLSQKIRLNRFMCHSNAYGFKGEEHAALYAEGRFSYPEELRNDIIEFMNEDKRIQMPVDSQLDVGCGSGQATSLLSDKVKSIIGVDSSEAQIKEAIKRNRHKNVRFIVGASSTLPAVDSSVDLITVAMAMHWFPIDKFYEEVSRVLKPGGCLAVWGYRYPTVKFKNHPEGSEIVSNMFTDLYTKDWLDAGLRHKNALVCDTLYQNVKPCFDNVKRVYFTLEMQRTLDGLLLLVSSYSPYQKMLHQNPSTTFLADMKKRILNAIGNPDSAGETNIQLAFPLFLMLSRKP